jgi:hypothetical protein
MGVEAGGGDQGVEEGRRRARTAEEAPEEVGGGDGQKAQQAVHPRLLGVVDGQGRDGGQKRGPRAHSGPQHPPPQPSGQGDRQQTDVHGKGTDGELAIARRDAPEVEQQVVARGVDVPPRRRDDQWDGTLGRPDGVPLVVPEGLGIQPVEAQASCQKENHTKTQRPQRI